jgi:hypothetical protein
VILDTADGLGAGVAAGRVCGDTGGDCGRLRGPGMAVQLNANWTSQAPGATWPAGPTRGSSAVPRRTSQAATAIIVYNTVHTGAKTKFGGFQEGFLIVRNQVSTDRLGPGYRHPQRS